MSDRDLALLNAGRVCSRHYDGNVGRPCEETAILPERPMVLRFWFVACFIARQHVGGIATCADADGDVARSGQRLNLSREYPLKAVVICHRGKNGRNRLSARSPPGRVVNNKAPNEFSGEMLRISRAAAIAEEQKFASRGQAIANQKGGLDNLTTASCRRTFSRRSAPSRREAATCSSAFSKFIS